MDDNHPNTPAGQDDPEWERIRKMTPGLGDEEATPPNPEEDAAPDPTLTPSDPPATPADPPAEEPPVTDPPVADPPEDPPTDPPAPAQRPEKYIPVAKYTSEKRDWQQKVDDLTRDLEAANASRGQAREDAIKAFADEHGISEENVRSLVEKAGTDRKEGSPELTDELKTQLQQAEIVLAEKAYDTEFNSVAVPELKKQFPNATDAQLAAAKAEIEKLATTQEFLDKPLDFVIYKNAKDLAPLFAAQQQRKGPEQARQAPEHGTQDYTADDFKDGKTSFEELMKLPPEKQSVIMEAMDIPTYDQFKRYVTTNDKLQINRGGKKIEF